MDREITQFFITELAPIIAGITNISEIDLRTQLEARDDYAALPSSQEAIAKAEAKRQRKASRLVKQFGNK